MLRPPTGLLWPLCVLENAIAWFGAWFGYDGIGERVREKVCLWLREHGGESEWKRGVRESVGAMRCLPPPTPTHPPV
jgi:hypothetical protein